MAKLIYAYLVGVSAGFIMGAKYAYDYHIEQRDSWYKR